MKLFIKNMVCNRCKAAVQAELDKAGFTFTSIELGEVEIKETPTKEALAKLHLSLKKLGFELIDDRKSRLIEKIKTLVVERVHYDDAPSPVNLSEFLSKHLHYDYTYLSNLFSEVEGITIEKYFLAQKTEKIKELLMYDELTLSQIADKLNYSSVAHLSNQFKKQTGLSPSFYKSLKKNTRRNLDDL